jgi:hypothetical protein
MLKLTFPLSLIAVAALTACASHRVTPAPTAVIITPPAGTVVAGSSVAAAPSNPVTVTTPAVRAGGGVVDSISAVPQWSSSTGSAQPSSMRRIGVRMDDGTVQFLDTDAPSLRVGDRVGLTADGYIRNPAQ